MTQMVTRVGTSTAPTGVVTVADLLTRYAPDPMIEAEPVTEPVSVGSLLRREGRAPHAQDRPLAPRSRSASEDDGPRRGSGVVVRRSVIAAGTLLAAGSVFGATVVMDSSSTEAVDRPQTGYAGEGRLDLPQNPDGAIPTVVDTAAQTDQLDPGEAAPMSWSGVAFPRGASDGGQAAPADASRAPSTGPAVTPVDQGGSRDQGGSSADGRGNGSDSGDSNDDSGNGSGGSNDGDTGDTGLGSAVQDLGDDVGGPVGGVVSGLGSTVSAVGDLAGGLLS